MTMSTVFLNGDFLPEEQASISPLDRGFIFGDGVYEVIPVYNGHLFRLDEHLQRLSNSLSSVHITAPYNNDEWPQLLNKLATQNGGGNLSLYLQITRGIAQRDHAFPHDTRPTVFAMCNALHPVSEVIQHDGVKAITLDDTRWKNCHIKSISLLPNILLRQQALDNGAAEAILVRDNNVTEGAASNLFIVSDGTLITPPKGSKLLPGITRDLILELALNNNIPMRETEISMAALTAADEIWLSSSTKEIIPVTQLNETPVGNGKPGALWTNMIKLYQQYKQDYNSQEQED